MRPIRCILVAVKDPEARSHPAVLKAAQLAKALGARLELFHANSEPLYLDPYFQAYTDLELMKRDMQAAVQARLERLAAHVRRLGVAVSCSTAWDFPAADAVIRQAARLRADLIVADSHAGHHLAPWLLRCNDWELLRLSPLPVLVVRSKRRYRQPKVLAALDPAHALDKPAILDREILGAATTVCRSLQGELHAVHAYVPRLVGYEPAEMSQPDFSGRILELARSKATKAMARTLRGTRLPTERRHILMQHAVDAIPATAKRIRASIVVMGAVSRSGFKSLFIGNTAERVLDSLDCDVLVVKPKKFAARVTARAQGANLRPAFTSISR